nr:hypothetical protein [Bacteroidota bacterium]
SSWPDYQDASIFMTGGVINFNTGGIFIHETAFEQLTANITGGKIKTAGDFIVNVDNFQPQNLTLELDGPGDADILVAGNNHVQDIVIYKFPPTGPTDNQSGTGAFDPYYVQAVTGERELNGIVTAIGNVNITNNLEIEAGSFDVSQYHVSVANEINIDYFGTLIMNHPSGKLECEILNWMENSKDEITAGEIYCYNWNFYEYTLAQLGPGNTAYVTGWPYQEEVDASFGNLVLGPENPGKNYEGVGGNKIVTSGYFKIRSSVYLFDNPIEVGTDLIIEEPAILGIVSPGYIIVGWDLNLKGILQVFSGLVQVHGNFDFPDGAILDNAGTVRFDRPLGSYFELSGHLMMEEPESILEFTHHGVTIMPSFIGSINDGTIRVGSDFVASIMGTFTPQGGTLELLPHLEPGHPDPPYLWLANGNHLHNLTVNANTSAYLLQSHVYLKGDLTINSGELWAHLGNIEIEGNWTNNVANSFYPGSKTVSFIGDGISEIFTNEKFNNLTIYKTGASTEDVRIATGKNIQVESDLLITNGTLELNSSATLDIGKDLTLNSGAGLNAGGDDVLVEINIAGNWTDNNTSSNATTGFFPGTSTVVFDGTINQEVISGGAGETFYNLEIDKSSGNFTPSTNLVILNDLLVQNGLFYNLVSRSHQLHRNLSIQPGGQLLPYGTFTFAGSPVASFQDLGTATSFFENVIVNKESELNLLSQMTLLNGRDLLVQNGTLFVNGTNLGVSGDVLIEDDGILSMDLGSILEVGAGQVLDIDGGGLLEIIGSASEPCIITHFDDGFYEFNINGGGTISAENTIFEYVGQRYGVYLHPDAIVDPVHSFHECTFRNGDLQVQDAAFISFENDQEITVNDAVFVSGSVPYNVSKENGMGHVTFVNATGDLAGDAFENDPAGLIDWMGGNTLQSINLPQGWSGLSAFVQPDPDDIEMIFDPIVSDLTILQNNAGMYYPGQSINTIGPWASQAAFKIKMLNETMLDVFGSFEMNQTYPFM